MKKLAKIYRKAQLVLTDSMKEYENNMHVTCSPHNAIRYVDTQTDKNAGQHTHAYLFFHDYFKYNFGCYPIGEPYYTECIIALELAALLSEDLHND